MKFFIAIVTALSVNSVQADNSYSKEDKDAVCKSWGSLAAKIMELRQTEAPISRVLELVEGDDTSKLTREIVLKAYEQPSFLTKENQARATDTFRNEIELRCFQATN